ncbi:MAG: FkbM family methyltransferase, partial [Pseudoruegeria sp.]
HHEIFKREDYLRHGLKIPAGATIVDVGANVGFFSNFALQRAGANATLIALEPIPETFAALQNNVSNRTWEAGTKLHLFNAGATKIDGPDHLEFTYFPNLPGNSTSVPSEKEDQEKTLRQTFTHPVRYAQMVRTMAKLRRQKWLNTAILLYPLAAVLGPLGLSHIYRKKEHIRCPLFSLSQIIADTGISKIDFLKIDTEGAELDVLDGLTPQDWKMVKQVAIEVQDKDGRLKKIKRRLKRAGFKHVVIDKAADLSALSDVAVALVYAR